MVLIKKFAQAFFLSTLFLLLFSVTQAQAANRYWVGTTDGANTSDSTNWATAEGACGIVGGASVPTTTDIAIFTSSCTNGATINANWSIQGLSMLAGAGTVTQGTGITLTLGANGINQAGGTFVGSNAAINISNSAGDFTLSGGSFTATSDIFTITNNLTITGGTFVHNGGTVHLANTGATAAACNGATFNLVIIDKSSTAYTTSIGSDCTFTLSGTNPTSETNLTNNGTLNITGNWNHTGFYTQNAGAALTMTGTSLTTSGSLSLVGGTFPAGLTTLTVGGNLTNSGNLLPNGLDLTLNTINGSTVDCGTATFDSVTLSKTYLTLTTINSNCTFPIAGTNPTTSGRLINNGTIIVDGNLTHSGYYTSNSGAVLSMTGTNLSVSYDLILTAGTFPAGLTDLTVGGNLTNTANLLSNGLNLTLNTNTAGTYNCGTATFNSVVISKSQLVNTTIGSNCTFPLLGTSPTSAANILNSGTISVTGDWTVNGSYTSNTGAVLTMTGTTLNIARDLTLTTGTFPSGLTDINITISLNDAGSLIPAAATVTLSTGNATSLTCGTTRYSNFNIHKIGTAVITLNSDCYFGNFSYSGGAFANPATAKNIYINGNFTKSTTTTIGGSNITLNFDGANDQTLSHTGGTISSPIIINKTGGTATLGSDMTVTGQSCTFSAGTFDLNGYSFYCATGFSAQNGTTLKLQGNELFVTTPTLSSGTTVIYRGNTNTFANTFYIKNWAYHHLIVNSGDATDTFGRDNLQNNTVLNWPFDEVTGSQTSDLSGKNQPGTVTGATVVAGHTENALNFTGSTQFVKYTGNNTGLSGNFTGTLSVWVKPSNVGTVNQNVFGLAGGGVAANALVFLSEVNGGSGSISFVAGNCTQYTPSGAVSNDQWSHVVIVKTPGTISTSTTIYINGVAQTTATATGGFYSNCTPNLSATKIVAGAGWTTTDTDYQYYGVIDEARIYNVALSQDEVTALYNGSPYATETELSVAGNLTITAGILSAPPTITLGGNWANSGTFTHNSGTVDLGDASQSISGATTFYNLTKTVTSPATLTFPASSTQIIAGGLTLTGTSGNVLSLVSSSPATQWLINPQGTRTIQYAAVQDSNNINATAINVEGSNVENLGNNTNWQFDSTIPSVTVTALSPDPNSDSTPTLSGTATDTSGVITNVQFQVDSTSGSWSSCTATDGAFDELVEAYSCTTATLGDGAHTIYIRAVDEYSNTTASGDYATDTFTVDTTAPSVTVTALSPDPNSDSTPSITGTITDAHSVLSAIEYQVDSTSGSWSSCTANDGLMDETTEAFSCTTAALSDGAHTIYIRGTDALSNTNSGGSLGTDTFTIDTTAPTVPGTPAATSSTEDTTPTWNWAESTDAGSGMAASDTYTLQWSESSSFASGNSTATVTTSACSGGTCSYTHTTELAGGSWYFRVKATDALGNESAYSTAGSLLISTDSGTPPTGSIRIDIGSSHNPEYTSSRDATLTIAATDDSDASAVLEMMVGSDSAFTGSSWESFSAAQSFTLPEGDGTKTVYIKFKDTQGNTSEAYSDSITFDATAPLSFSLKTPANDTYTHNTRPSFRFKMTTDATSGLAQYHVLINSEIYIGSIDPNKPGDTDIRENEDMYVRYDGDYIEVYSKKDSGALANGTYDWLVQAVDRAGNVRGSERRTLHINTDLPVLQLSTIGTQNILLNSTSLSSVETSTTSRPTFTGIASAGATITVSLQSGEVLCTTVAENDSSWSCTLDTNLPGGRNTITISAQSKAGLTSTLPNIYLYVGEGTFVTSLLENGEDKELDQELAPEQEVSELTTEQSEFAKHSVVVSVIDPAGKPVAGAKVTIHSEPQEAISDENGQVKFDGVVAGEHTLVVEHDNKIGTQAITVSGDTEQIAYTITVAEANPFENPMIQAVIGVLAVIIIGLLVVVIKKK